MTMNDIRKTFPGTLFQIESNGDIFMNDPVGGRMLCIKADRPPILYELDYLDDLEGGKFRMLDSTEPVLLTNE